MLYKICALEDLWEGEIKGVVINNKPILLIHHKNKIYAYEDRCPHLGVALSKGKIEEEKLTCSAHGWSFQTTTGKGINPEHSCLKTYKAEVRNGEIFLEVENS